MSAIISEIQNKSVLKLQEQCEEVMSSASQDALSFVPINIDDIVSRFVEQINKSFASLMGDSDSYASGGIDFDNLSIIVGDELDVVMTTDRMVTLARKKFLSQFAKLSVRMDTLLESGEFNESNNPLDPDQLFKAFKEALRPLNLDPDRSVRVYKIFDSVIMAKLDSVLNDANQILIDANVLPELGLGGDEKGNSVSGQQKADDKSRGRESGKSAETAEVSAIVGRIQQASMEILKEQFDNVLFAIESDILPLSSPDREDACVRFAEHLINLFEQIKGDPKYRHADGIDFNSLSLILEDELEVVMAVEGMVSAARHQHMRQYVNFSARMNELLAQSRIHEANNPLDPDHLFTAFKEATRPFGVTGKQNLDIFRLFNTTVLSELRTLLTRVNQILIDENILPDLELAPAPGEKGGVSRRAPRSVSSKEATSNYGLPVKGSGGKQLVEAQKFEEEDDNPELFAMVQGLMHGESSTSSDSSSAVPAPAGQPGQFVQPGQTGQFVQPPIRQYVIPDELLAPRNFSPDLIAPPSNQTVQVIDQRELLELLSSIQVQLSQLSRLSNKEHEQGQGQEKGQGQGQGQEQNQSQEMELRHGLAASETNIKATLAGLLKEHQAEGVVNAVDRKSSDAINLVELLYEAIWNDESVPIPIKELIGRTQITVIMVVLNDTSFFNQADHPVRALLNEFASAGIGWSEVEDLESDSLYQKISHTVQYILAEYRGQDGFFEELLKDFQTYRAREAARGRRLEQRIKHTRGGEARAEFARKLVSQRIEERILGREIDPFVKDFLNDDFHKFMVLLVLKEGPGSKAWKQAVNTIDVLMWSVQSHEHPGDRARLDSINPRLLNNLQRALRIASLDAETIAEKLDKLQQIQQGSFRAEPESELPVEEILDAEEVESIPVAESSEPDALVPGDAHLAEETLADDDPLLKQVDEFGVGLWFEFHIDDEHHVRCKLAARINAIDKLIFVNRQGVKVIEKTRMGLALELKHESVKVISDGLLFTRALESVIGNLRESQTTHQNNT